MRQVAVLGAGISGLNVCYKLQKVFNSSVKIVLFEASEKIGGWIQSIEKEGFLFELGPRSLRATNRETLKLIEELNLNDEIVLASPQCKRRYILGGAPVSLNEVSLWRSPLIWRSFWKDLWAKKGDASDETVFSFISRRLGEQVATNFFDPLTKGIFAGDITKLSIRSCFPQLFQAEQKYKSLIFGSFFLRERFSPPNYLKGAPFFSFKRGLKTLPEALFKRLKVEVRFLETLKNMEEFSHVYTTIPAYRLFELLKEESLLDLPFNSVSTVSFGFRQGNLLKKRGFGYLVPSFFQTPILGCVFDSDVFPEQNAQDETRLTFMILGADFSDEELLALSKGALFEHLGIDKEPDVVHFNRASKAIPQYPVNYHLNVKALKEKYPNITFLGNSFTGVSINDCIKGF